MLDTARRRLVRAEKGRRGAGLRVCLGAGRLLRHGALFSPFFSPGACFLGGPRPWLGHHKPTSPRSLSLKLKKKMRSPSARRRWRGGLRSWASRLRCARPRRTRTPRRRNITRYIAAAARAKPILARDRSIAALERALMLENASLSLSNRPLHSAASRSIDARAPAPAHAPWAASRRWAGGWGRNSADQIQSVKLKS